MSGAVAADLRAITVCQGGEEPYELHVRYCVPLAEQINAVIAALMSEARDSKKSVRLAPCRCGHPGAGCSCYEERRAAADRAEAEQ